MNFLAHLFLSGEDNEIKLGNFIGDWVKGSNHQKYSQRVQQGILLHRKIDHFTDTHLITKDLSKLIKTGYNRHSGIVIDIFYDHFLSLNWSRYSEIPINIFINESYKILVTNFLILPAQVKNFLPVLIAKNRLMSYSDITGIENALKTMSKYTSLPASSKFAIEILRTNYNLFNQRFLVFFDEIITYVESEREIFENQNVYKKEFNE